MRKHPQIAKKNGSKSEKYKFTNIFTGFFQRGQVLLKGFQQNSMNQKAKVTFCLEMVMIPPKNKQARKLQATLPIRNYESLTYLLTDGGEV